MIYCCIKKGKSMTKICKQCGSEKKFDEFFNKVTGKHGKQAKCKVCDTLNKSNYRKTKKGIITQIYGTQRGSSIRRGHSEPTYTKKELTEWLYSQTLFHTIYDNWKRLGYQKSYVPSVDRLDNSIGYTLDNIRIVTWAENKHNGHEDRKNGLDALSKPVNQYDMDGKFIFTHHSIIEAGRVTSTDSSSIGNCCRSKTKTIKKKYIAKCMSAGGYMWRYSKNNDCSDILPYKSRGKQIAQYTKEGIFISFYNSAYEASDKLGLDRKSISNCCIGKTKSSGGYRWQYSDNGGI